MKSILAVAFCLVSSAVFAQDQQNNKEQSLQEQKAFITQILDKRIAALNEKKSCVSSAGDREALQRCHEELKDDRQAIQQEVQGYRQKRKVEHEERKAEREVKRAERKRHKADRKKN